MDLISPVFIHRLQTLRNIKDRKLVPNLPFKTNW